MLSTHLACHAGLGKDIELRHQRKADVIFDTMRSSPGMSLATLVSR